MIYSIFLLLFSTLSLLGSAQQEEEIDYSTLDIREVKHNPLIGDLFAFGAQYVLDQGGNEGILNTGDYQVTDFYYVGRYINETGTSYKFFVKLFTPFTNGYDVIFSLWKSKTGERQVVSYEIRPHAWTDSWRGKVSIRNPEPQPDSETPVEHPTEEENPRAVGEIEEVISYPDPMVEEQPLEETPHESGTEEAIFYPDPTPEEYLSEELINETVEIDPSDYGNGRWTFPALSHISFNEELIKIGTFGIEAFLDKGFSEGKIPYSETYKITSVLYVQKGHVVSEGREWGTCTWNVLYGDDEGYKYQAYFTVYYTLPWINPELRFYDFISYWVPEEADIFEADPYPYPVHEEYPPVELAFEFDNIE